MADSSTEDVHRAVQILRDGGLVAFPTETVYGLGADATNPSALGRLFEVKGRPTTHPVIVHLDDTRAMDEWGIGLSDDARLLAHVFWPGPLTLLVKRRVGRVLDAITGGTERVGLRVPSHPVALALLEQFGAGIAAPSANRFGAVSPTTATHVRADLGDDVDLVLDGGATDVGVESTIVDCTTEPPEVVRPGGVSLEALQRTLGRPVGLWHGDRSVRAPGTLAAHYAPRAEVRVVARSAEVIRVARGAIGAGRRVGVLAPDHVDDLPHEVRQLAPAGDATDYARVLYDRLREADRRGVEVLVVIPPDDEGIGRAVRDRLMRAAATVSKRS